MSAVCLAASVRFWFILPGIRKFVRPVYVQRGILPEIAEGLRITDGPQTVET
jgi:hypothetical protein